MKISVVTVCYNEEKNIAKTVRSVLHQTSGDFEYIVCDGKSKDNTVSIAESFRADFEAKGISYRILSEKDGGVYFGMNNGIDLATGDYVIFINAGDRFHSDNVIEAITSEIKDRRPEVIYGNCAMVDRGAVNIVYAKHENLECNMSICHPSTLVRSDIIKQNKFDTSFKIAADYNMMLTLYCNHCEFFKIELVISDFFLDGISSVNVTQSLKEACRVKKQHGIDCNEEEAIAIAKRNQRIINIKRSIPGFLWKFWSKTIKKKPWMEN